MQMMGFTNSGEPKARLDRLPVELVQEILAALPDVESLVSAVLTGPCLYLSFLGAECYITKEVLLRQIDPDLLHDAVAELSSRRTPWTEQETGDFLAQYFARDKRPFHSLLKWKLSQALPLIRLHHVIDFFLNDLTSPILAGNPMSKKPVKPCSTLPLSCSEKNRITLNFYRFQIYCNLFRGRWGNKNPIDPPIHSIDQKEKYFQHFAPWENEQLCCIHDYLLRIITPGLTSPQVPCTICLTFLEIAFEEVAESDPDWIEYFEIKANGLDDGTLQHCLSLGLAHIRRFAEANTPQERRDILSSELNQHSYSYFLPYTIDQSRTWGPALRELGCEGEVLYISKPWYSDSDTGPEDAWRWAVHSQPVEEFIFSPSQEPLRQWFYVMWDRARLDEWNVFENPWEERVDRDQYDIEKTIRIAEETAAIEARSKDLEDPDYQYVCI